MPLNNVSSKYKTDIASSFSSPLKSLGSSASPLHASSIATGRGSTSFSQRAGALLQKVKDFFSTICGWIWWIVRLCPTENPYLDIVEELIDTPKEAARNYGQKPAVPLSEIIAATLLDPKKVSELREESSQEIRNFVTEFKQECASPQPLFFGENGIQRTIGEFLGFKRLSENHILVEFALKHPAVIARAIKRYCTLVLNTVGNKPSAKEEELEGIRGVLALFIRVSEQQKSAPEDFKAFLLEAFKMPSFDVNKLAECAENKLNIALSEDDRSAINACREGRNQALHRLATRPDLLHSDLTDASLGPLRFYQSLLRELGPDAFRDLAKLFEQDYPLLAEVLKRLEEIANSGQLDKVCANLPRANEVLTQLWKDYARPPAID